MAEEKKDSVFNVDHLTNDQIVIVMKKFYEQDGNPDWDMVKDMIDPMDRTNKLKTLSVMLSGDQKLHKEMEELVDSFK